MRPPPLVLVLNHELARAREEVCDNHVLAEGDGRRYARTLLELSEMLAPAKVSPSALSLFPPRWRLEERVAGLLDTRRKTMTHSNRFAAAGVAVALSASVALIGGTRMLRAEQLPVEQPPAEQPRAERAGRSWAAVAIVETSPKIARLAVAAESLIADSFPSWEM